MGSPAHPRNVDLLLYAAVVIAAPARSLDLSVLWGRAKAEPIETERSYRLDPLSVRCMGCHAETADDSKLSVIGSRIAGHPVGVKYRDAWQRNTRSLRAPISLHPSVALPGGCVTCLSCHRPRAVA